MNFGKYAIDEPEEDGSSQRGQTPRDEPRASASGRDEPRAPASARDEPRASASGGDEPRASASGRENPPVAEPLPRHFGAHAAAGRGRQPLFTSMRRFPSIFYNPWPGPPPYWSNSYVGPSTSGFTGSPVSMCTGYTSRFPTVSAVAGASSGVCLAHASAFIRPGFPKRSVASYVNAPLKWTERGIQLRNKVHPITIYSVKVFLGGLSQDTTLKIIQETFAEFEVVRVMKDSRDSHAYLILRSDAAVKNLLSKCRTNVDGTYFYMVSGRFAQVIPWALQDMEWGERIELKGEACNLTIFVGGLHGETTAEHLKIIMEDKFGQVLHVKIDVDKLLYPSGSGRVQFMHPESFFKAVEANFLEINTKHYSRTVQMEPFFDRFQPCSRCGQLFGVSICRYQNCLKYFCGTCFERHRIEQGQSSYLHSPIRPH